MSKTYVSLNRIVFGVCVLSTSFNFLLLSWNFIYVLYPKLAKKHNTILTINAIRAIPRSKNKIKVNEIFHKNPPYIILNEVKRKEKFLKLLEKICKDFGFNDYQKIIKEIIDNKKWCDNNNVINEKIAYLNLLQIRYFLSICLKLVAKGRFELSTPWVWTKCSSQLSYFAMFCWQQLLYTIVCTFVNKIIQYF